tara:strand:- start:4664 stop:4810 length:147 start_codon:yes stop_codon:yes gene_type:complete
LVVCIGDTEVKMSEATMVSMQIEGFIDYAIVGVVILMALVVAYWGFKR